MGGNYFEFLNTLILHAKVGPVFRDRLIYHTLA
jgi:hypothetical protein